MTKEKLKSVLSSIDEKIYEVIITEQDKNYSIAIKKKMRKCCLCKEDKYYKNLTIRQDSRVPYFMVAKKICRQCLPNVNLILNNLKDSVKSPLTTGKW